MLVIQLDKDREQYQEKWQQIEHYQTYKSLKYTQNIFQTIFFKENIYQVQQVIVTVENNSKASKTQEKKHKYQNPRTGWKSSVMKNLGSIFHELTNIIFNSQLS